MGVKSPALRRIVLAAAPIAILATLVGCGSSGPNRTSLANEDVAQLQFSGSKQLVNGGIDAQRTIEGDIPAISWRRYGVNARWDEIVAFFDNELSRRGWEPGGGSSGLRSTGEKAVEAWHFGDRILRLGDLRKAPVENAGQFVTFYEVALIGQGLPIRTGSSSAIGVETTSQTIGAPFPQADRAPDWASADRPESHDCGSQETQTSGRLCRPTVRGPASTSSARQGRWARRRPTSSASRSPVMTRMKPISCAA